MKKDWAIIIVKLVKSQNSDGLVNHGKNQVSFITILVKLLNSDTSFFIRPKGWIIDQENAILFKLVKK